MTKELEALKRIRQETCPATYMADFDKNECCDVIEQALLELKSIKEANPSEALKCLEQLAEMADKCWVSCDVYKWKNTIKQALLKAQEQEQYYFDLIQLLKENNMDYYTLKEMFKQQEPKHYLKWEDLEFKEEEQVMDVLLNGKPYVLYFYKLSTQSEVNMFSVDMHIVTLNSYYPEDVQFFNDLHLEKVEE